MYIFPDKSSAGVDQSNVNSRPLWRQPSTKHHVLAFHRHGEKIVAEMTHAKLEN